MAYRVIVAGGRVAISQRLVEAVLDRLSVDWPGDTILVHGCAQGTDTFAGNWGSRHGFAVQPMPVDSALDDSFEDAPKRRNARMLAEAPDCILAFPGGPGTRHMVKIGDAANVPIYDVEIDGDHFRVWLWGGREKASFVTEGEI